jgi:hypothetical protein
MKSWPFACPPRITLGTSGSRLWPSLLRLPLHEATTHMHIIGKSGSGKSGLLAALYLDLLAHGIPVSIIDPHGDLAELVLRHLVARGFFDTEEGYRKVWYLDIGGAEKVDHYLPFNLVVQDAPPHSIAADLKEAMHRAFPELQQGAPTFDSLLPRAVRVLIANQRPVTELERFLLDGEFRAALLARYRDPSNPNIARFFAQAYEAMSVKDQVTYAGSVMRRAQLLTDLPVLYYSLAQRDNVLQLSQLFDAGVSMILNLAVRDEEAKRLLGCLLTVGAEQAAKARASTWEADRGKKHVLLIDEAPLFLAQSSEALGSMLSQTRKFGINVGIAHQDWSQVANPRLRGALGNVGLMVVLKLEPEDARIAARRIGTVDPKTVRQSVADDMAESVSRDDQWEAWAQQIAGLEGAEAASRRRRGGEAFMRLSSGAVHRVHCPYLPRPQVDRHKLAEVKAEYLARYFRAKADVQADLRVQYEEPVRSTAPRRRVPHTRAAAGDAGRGGEPMDD